MAVIDNHETIWEWEKTTPVIKSQLPLGRKLPLGLYRVGWGVFKVQKKEVQILVA